MIKNVIFKHLGLMKYNPKFSQIKRTKACIDSKFQSEQASELTLKYYSITFKIIVA